MYTLIEWATHYIKHKDIMLRSITDIAVQDDKIVVSHKAKQMFYLVHPILDDIDGIFKKLDEREDDMQPALIVLNMKKNLKTMVKNWKKFIEYHPMFLVIFANPDSSTDTKWVVFPKTHSNVADPESLKKGLKSMFEMVDEVTDSKAKNY